MIEFIVQHPIQSVIILFILLGVLSRLEILFRRKFSNNQTVCSDGVTVTKTSKSVEIVDERGTRIVIKGDFADEITINGKSVF